MSSTAMNAPSIAPSNATQCRAETALASGARLEAAALQFAVVEFKPTLFPDLDLCDGRHAGHEAAFAIAHALAVESDPDRHTLDDSGEVARGVVRRQQRELGAAGRSEALDPASKYAAGKGVHMQPHGLAWLNPGKLRLFEVGYHPSIRLDQCQQCLPRLDAVAGFEVLLPDPPRRRGKHLGIGKLELGVFEGCLGNLFLRLCGDGGCLRRLQG